MEIHINYETQIIPHGQDAADYTKYCKSILAGRNCTGDDIEFTHKSGGWWNTCHRQEEHGYSRCRIRPDFSQALEIVKSSSFFTCTAKIRQCGKDTKGTNSIRCKVIADDTAGEIDPC